MGYKGRGMPKKCHYCNKGTFVLRYGKFGDFYGCSEYPRCAGMQKIPKSKSDDLELEADKWLAKYDN